MNNIFIYFILSYFIYIDFFIDLFRWNVDLFSSDGLCFLIMLLRVTLSLCDHLVWINMSDITANEHRETLPIYFVWN